jgi:TonB-like protein
VTIKRRVSPRHLVGVAGPLALQIVRLPPFDGDYQVASSVNLKSGLLAVGALRPDESNSQEPIALETTVVATGARPGDSTAKRELFSEETQTVLVFERGAVIRLSAAVADGQLLFLTNKSTGKEVVTQVVRKRAFRPTNCYVDLEFTEASPGFWGIEFPKAPATPSAGGASVTRKLAADEDSENETVKPAAPPSAHEVERLKQEVTTLQSQLKSLLNTELNAVSYSAAQPEVKALAEISAGPEKKEEEKRLQELLAQEAKQEDASSPKILVPNSLRSAEGRAEKKSSKTLLNVAAVLLVLGAVSFAASRFGALDDLLKMAGLTKSAPSHAAAAAVKPPAPKPIVPATTPAAASATPILPAGTADLAIVASAATAPLLEEKNPATVVDAANVTEWKDNTAGSTHRAVGSRVSGYAPTNSAIESADSGGRVRSRSTAPAANTKRNNLHAAAGSGTQPGTVAGNAAAPASPSSVSDSSVAVAADAEGVVAPKLIRGHKSMAPPEMIRNYITGNVNVDALVDATGHVRSVSVLSGPEKLRATAIEEMKQYLYQPAGRNGKPVPAHVQVSLQFWYEP